MEKSFKKNATLLTLLMLVKKLLSIVYKIPYQNLTGDAGFYVFQQVYPFIALLMLLTGFALPTVIGSLLVENHYSSAIKDQLKRTMWFFSLAAFALFLLGNRQIALMMGDVRLAPVIRMIGIHFLFLPPIAYMRGVLQSRPETLKKLGHSIVTEQLVRVIAVLIVLSVIDISLHSYYRIAELALMFSVSAPMITLMHLYVINPIDHAQSFLPLKEKPQFLRRTLFLMLGAGILVLFGIIDSFLVFNGLIQTVAQTEAMILRGVLERGLPLLQAGTFFVGSLVSLTMTQFEKAKNEKGKRIAFSNGMLQILALATPATIGLIMVMPYLNAALFTDQLGTLVLQIIVSQVVLYAMTVLLTAILSKEGKQTLVLAALLGGILTKLVTTVPLTRSLGIEGAALSTVISLFVICLTLLTASKYLLTFKLFVALIGIVFSTFIMWISLSLLRGRLTFLETGARSGYVYLLGVHVGIGMLVYGTVITALVAFFRYRVKLVLLRHQRRQARIRRAEVIKQQEEAFIRERYRQSLMQNQPQKSRVTANEHLEGRGHWKRLEERQSSKNSHASVAYNDLRRQKTAKARLRHHIKKEGKTMRLDKFLKVSRIIKRRQTAKEVSDAGKISVNGKVAKSSTVLQQGDEITLHYATRTLVVKVKEIKDSTKKEDAQLMYEIVEERHLNSCPFGWT